jgi:hypothetical protein
VAEHLKVWSENRPEIWFDLAFSELNGSYGVSIFPNLERSLERFKIANQIRTGYPIDEKNSEFRFIFKPLHFISENLICFNTVKPKLGKSTKVFLLDRDDLDVNNPSLSSAIELGRLNISCDNGKTEWINNVLSKRVNPSAS